MQLTRPSRDESVAAHQQTFQDKAKDASAIIEGGLNEIFESDDHHTTLAKLQMIAAIIDSVARASAADILAGRVQINGSQSATPTNAPALGGLVDKEHELARRLKDDPKFARLVAAFEDDSDVAKLVEDYAALPPNDQMVVLAAVAGVRKGDLVTNRHNNTITRPRPTAPAQPASSGTTTSGGASSSSSTSSASGSSGNPIPASGVVGHKPVANQANSGGQSGQQTGGQGTQPWQTGPNNPNTTTAPMPPVPAAPATPASGKGNGRRGNG